jgi:hypothetical protein
LQQARLNRRTLLLLHTLLVFLLSPCCEATANSTACGLCLLVIRLQASFNLPQYASWAAH